MGCSMWVGMTGENKGDPWHFSPQPYPRVPHSEVVGLMPPASPCSPLPTASLWEPERLGFHCFQGPQARHGRWRIEWGQPLCPSGPCHPPPPSLSGLSLPALCINFLGTHGVRSGAEPVDSTSGSEWAGAVWTRHGVATPKLWATPTSPGEGWLQEVSCWNM